MQPTYDVSDTRSPYNFYRHPRLGETFRRRTPTPERIEKALQVQINNSQNLSSERVQKIQPLTSGEIKKPKTLLYSCLRLVLLRNLIIILCVLENRRTFVIFLALTV